MDFNLSEEQEILKRTARDFLSDNCPISLVREMEEDEKGYSPKLWQEIAELGWLGLIFPEKYSGGEGDFLDLAVLLEEMGRSLVPGPFLSTILGGLLILEASSEEQKQILIPNLVHGQAIFSLALSEFETEFNPVYIATKAVLEGNHYAIAGTKLFVPDAHVADYIVCVARTADTNTSKGLTLFLVDRKNPRLECNLLKTIAGDKQCEVIFDKAEIPHENILGEINKGWSYIERILPKAAVAKSMEMLGGAQRVLEMTTEYAKTRVQFDQLIGGFQAIQHHCANMLIDINGARYLAYRTAWMISEGIPCVKECYMTKAWVNNAYYHVVRLGTQVHGGIGVMKDHDMQLYFRHAKAAEASLGAPDFCREKVAAGMGL